MHYDAVIVGGGLAGSFLMYLEASQLQALRLHCRSWTRVLPSLFWRRSASLAETQPGRRRVVHTLRCLACLCSGINGIDPLLRHEEDSVQLFRQDMLKSAGASC